MPPAAVDAGAARARRRSARVVGIAAVAQLCAALAALALVAPSGQPPAPVRDARARAAPLAVPSVDPARVARQERSDAVTALLAQRSRAVLARDRTAFLATVDPAATALRTRQAATFDALAAVPLQQWDYALDGASERPDDLELDRRYGADRWWSPDVQLRYEIQGFDDRPVTADHHLTFVRRDGRWLLGADDDFAEVGLATPRALWDRGPVRAVRQGGVLVLGHPDVLPLMRDVATATGAAVPRVSAVWGADWNRRAVVLVPESQHELAGLLSTSGDLSQIAAVATAELAAGSADPYDPSGDRILVNPDTFRRLGPLGRRVVLTHELTHVASRRATGPGVPAWLAEGLADYVGYTGVDVPLAVAARELKADVKAGRVPTRLPTDADFDGANPRLAQAYEQSWLAVRRLAERYGRDRMLAFYRATGAARAVTADEAVEQAVQDTFSSTTAAVTTDWQDYLRSRLG